MTLADLPDTTPVWIDGHGASTLGEIRAAIEPPVVEDDWQCTLNMWGDIAASRTNRHPWEPDLTIDQIRAYHAMREPGDPPRLFG